MTRTAHCLAVIFVTWAALLAVPDTSYAQGILCAGPQGQLRLASASCRPSESPVTLSGIGGGVTVVDSIGQVVGTSFGVQAKGRSYPSAVDLVERLLMKVAGETFTLPATRDGFGGDYADGWDDDQIFFNGPACTGDAYFMASTFETTDRAIVPSGVYYDGNAYVRDFSASEARVFQVSMAAPSSSSSSGPHCIEIPLGQYGHRRAKVIDVSRFVPPFSIQP